MNRSWWYALACAVAMGATPVAHAQDVEVARIREELKQLKEAYEKRIQALERRLQETEARVERAGLSETHSPMTADSGATRQNTAGAFNPAMSLILQGTAARSTRDPEAYRIGGFVPSGGEVAPAKRGLSLAESELVVGANVDPYFRGHLVVAIAPENEVEIEEAYFQTLALGRGLSVKGGRFLSGIGYQNELHRHAWDFQDAPLAYKAFLGGQLNDDGLQLKWVAPTEMFLELGAELLRGARFPAADGNRNGAGAWSVFAHAGGDLGESLAWRAGVSLLRASPRGREFEDSDSLGNPVQQSYAGSSRVGIADFVLKWAPGGNASLTNFKLQGEYFRRRESGALTYDDTGQAIPQFGAAITDRYASRQSGWYLQSVYQFVPRWRIGYRHDRLDSGRVDNAIAAAGTGPNASDFALLMNAHNPTRNTWMVDWSPSEFSRLRLQFVSDRSQAGPTDRQALLQYIFSLGAHGAHRF